MFHITRRDALILGLGGLGALALPRFAFAQSEDEPIVLTSAADLFCVYVNRATGRVEMVKRFDEVNPEIKEGRTARFPYKPPTKDIYLGIVPTLFKLDVARFGLVEPSAENYAPGEYTHHFLLSLSDREMGREELGDWALAHASEAQKETALTLLHRVHRGYNGRLVTGDTEKMLEATRFYTGRELLRPTLYLTNPPAVGDLAMLGEDGIQVAALGTPQLALATDNKLSGNIQVDGSMSNDVSAAGEGATKGASGPGAAVGGTASVGTRGGGRSSAGDGGSGSGGNSGDGGGAGGGAGGGGGGGGGSGE